MVNRFQFHPEQVRDLTNVENLRATLKDQFFIFPFIHDFSNVIEDKDQVREVRVPDVAPSDYQGRTWKLNE